jgi:hypothetical protein
MGKCLITPNISIFFYNRVSYYFDKGRKKHNVANYF